VQPASVKEQYVEAARKLKNIKEERFLKKNY